MDARKQEELGRVLREGNQRLTLALLVGNVELAQSITQKMIGILSVAFIEEYGVQAWLDDLPAFLAWLQEGAILAEREGITIPPHMFDNVRG